MATIFIAVQCYQCSTMQVKQQRKSGNKWTCAVCNEKQSVQKVFARAPMAKDVRKFVQNFNMSRKFADEQTKADELLDGGIVDDDQLACSPSRKRRSDWSEYLDLEEDRSQSGRENEGEIGSDFDDGKIVTEFPEVRIRKSGSKSRSSWSEDGEGDGLYKPVFSKRKHIAKNLSSQDEIQDWKSPSAIHASKLSKVSEFDEKVVSKAKHLSSKDEIRDWKSSSAIHASKLNKGISEFDEKVVSKAKHLSSKDEFRNWELPSDIQASKWSKGISKDDENRRTKTCILAKVRGPSKWSEYIDEEDNCGARNGENMATEQGMDNLKMMINDEMVEDDIHPDFK